MRRTIPLAAAATGAAIIAAFVGTTTASADPAPDDPPVYADVKAPASVPGDATVDTEGVSFEPLVRNTIEDDAGPVTVTIDLASADAGTEPVLTVESDDDRCAVAAATVTCELDALPSGFTETFALRLFVVDDQSWKPHPVTDFAMRMTGGAADTATDSTHVYDARYDDVERIDFVLPEVIPNDMVPGTEGVPVRFRINNDIGQELRDAVLTVTIKGLGGNDPSTVIGADDDRCTATDTTLTCPVEVLAAGQFRTFEARLWAGDNYDGNLASEVDCGITWTADGTEHTFAKRVGYSWVAYDE